jgi:caa(3)-type oxidase subunit IV
MTEPPVNETAPEPAVAAAVEPAHHHEAAAHAPSSHRRTYWLVFVWLFVLTVLEVGVVYVPGIAKGLLVSALVLLAVTKASLVGLFYMHLHDETRWLKLTVAIPMAIPALYAFVLIAEAIWRLIG